MLSCSKPDKALSRPSVVFYGVLVGRILGGRKIAALSCVVKSEFVFGVACALGLAGLVSSGNG